MAKSVASMSSGLATEFVQVALGVLAWILPNIDLLTKVMASIVLIAIWAFARVGAGQLQRIPLARYIGMTLVAIFVGSVEYFLVAFLLQPDLDASFWNEIGMVLQVGFAYGVFLGLPLQAYAYQKPPSKIGRISLLTCLLLVVFLLLAGYGILPIGLEPYPGTQSMQQLKLNIAAFLLGPGGVLASIWYVGLEWWSYGIVGILISFGIPFYLQNLQFEIFGQAFRQLGSLKRI